MKIDELDSFYVVESKDRSMSIIYNDCSYSIHTKDKSLGFKFQPVIDFYEEDGYVIFILENMFYVYVDKGGHHVIVKKHAADKDGLILINEEFYSENIKMFE